VYGEKKSVENLNAMHNWKYR